MKRIFALAFAAAMAAVPLAQEHQHGDTAATSLGTVNFPTSCASAVQPDFDRGLALLYSFEYDASRDVFLAVAAKDPGCAMAHWGAAMTHFHALWGEIDVDAGAREASLAREAAAGNPRTTDREKQYIAAVSAIYAQKDATLLERAKAFEDGMARVHAASASDDEASILYALALDESAPRDPAYANQKKCGEILEPLFQKLPNHPGIAHYIIHCYDNDVLAAKGLSAARAYARIAPGSAHATHMPSHIFVRLSLWQETIDSNLASMEVAERASGCRERGSLLHAMHFLQFAYLQVGRANEARKVAERALSLPAGKDCDAGEYVAASYALDAHDWAMAKRVADRHSASSRPSDNIVVLLGVGVGAARTGDLTRAQKAEQALAEWRDARRKEAHIEQGFDGPRLIVAAWSAEARQDHAAALDLMRTAEEKGTVADRSTWIFPPTSEQFGDLLMQQNKPDQALAEYRKALAGTADLFNALYGAARAAEAAGNQEEARGYYLKMTEVAGSGDRPEVEIAKKKLGGEQQAPQPTMDRDLLEITIPQLEQLYRTHKYTVTEVVRWYIARIEKYNGIYRAVETLDASGALATAAREDAEARAGGASFVRGPMWGVPIVIKANTSIKGQITTDGWKGYIIPGHELIAPKDAPIVTKLRAAGVVILGHTNMPDFAASDTNRSTSYGRTGNAYDVRFSPGGSSGGTVTAVTSNFAVLGNGTDTGNSIRMPAATSALVGVFPTRGLVSIAGIAPLDWLLDNTGPIARDVTDAAIALGVMAGEDPADPRTAGSAAKAQPGPYTQYLKPDALKGKRFGVPAFILAGADTPFQGIDAAVPPADVAARMTASRTPLRPETRAAFMKSLDGLRAAGATVVFDDSILPESFAATVARVGTLPYVREGTEKFLAEYGPAQYHSADEYQRVVGSPLPPTIIGGAMRKDRPAVSQAVFENDPHADDNVLGPRKRALDAYHEALDRLHLDGFVYPATQMPPPDETMPQDGEISGGPHSATAWVNMIGVPAIVVPGGFYPSGLPFGLELSTRPWKDGDLLGWAFAYEQATRHRKPPVLVEKGLLRIADRTEKIR